MRILFLNHYAGTFGGVEAYVRWTAEALSARGHQCFLGRVEDTGYGMETFLEPFQQHWKATVPHELARIATELSPDVVFLHKLDGTAAFLHQKPRLRLVRYVHDHDLCCPRRHKYYSWTGQICNRPAGVFCHLDIGFVRRNGASLRLQSPRAFFGELAANRGVDLLLVGSTYMYDELLQNGFSPQQVALVPPIPPAAAPMEWEKSTDNRAPTVLYVGQLIRGKGVDVLLRAFAEVRRQCSAARLIIAGKGNARERLVQLAAKLGIDADCTFEGLVSREELDALYRHATVVVVPSRWPEPFGMVGLEAMQRGTAVVGSRAGGIPDWLHDGVNGVLVPPANYVALAHAICRLLENPDLAHRMGEAGAQMVKERFDHACAMEALELYLAGRV